MQSLNPERGLYMAGEMADSLIKFCNFCRVMRGTSVVLGRSRVDAYKSTSKRFIKTSSIIKCDHKNSTSEEEIAKFGLLSSEWWNNAGDFSILKAMNRLRIPWIKSVLFNDLNTKIIRPLESFKILDVGCGGGLLSEPLARLGAKVTGIDAVAENIITANAHAMIDDNVARNTEYICSTVEDLVDEKKESFDVVIASEVIEHVNNQSEFVKSCSHMIKPGGHMLITTINRTLFSLLFAKYAAEYIVRIVPAGVHEWDKFVTTDEMTDMLRKSNMEMIKFTGMTYNVFTQRWYWCDNTGMNYACHARKPLL